MMDTPLTLTHLLERSARFFPDKAVVSVARDGNVERLDWGRIRERTGRLAGALLQLGLRRGDRVATLAWNTHRHLELYFAVPALGAVLHTINGRLSREQIARIVAHAGDRFLFADPELAELVEGVAGPQVRVAVDGVPPGPEWLDYETLLASSASLEHFAALEENDAAALCYTSGTTGEPKGVLYSHRALALHTLAICLPNGFGIGEADRVLPAVPMFHANAWGLPFAAALAGASLILPGPRPGAQLLARLLEEERVTFAAGVPTVWLGVLDALRDPPRPLAKGLRIHSGGAPSPAGLIRAWESLGVEIVTGWGMTELSPVGLVCHPRADMEGWGEQERMAVRTSQGTPLPYVELRLVDADGAPVPRDGVTPGELEVRGPWVAAEYFAGADTVRGGAGGAPPSSQAEPSFRDGWLRTGDVATLDQAGYVRLVDRTKDLIRSGGEWISSVQLENALMDHPAVSEAAVVAVPHPRWHERPVAYVVLRAGAQMENLDALRAVFDERFPSWWVPDRIEVVDAIPRTSTGKFDKKVLRALAKSLSEPGAPSL
jgi:fatty-acyl-CoA synthase